jgi:hypothetical protein
VERKINLYPWKEITLSTNIDNHTLFEIFTILIEKDGEYFFIIDEVEKIFDVSQMPNYIKEDWIKYNRKELSISVINEQINKLNNDFDLFVDEINLLKSLRRSLIINGVLK